MSRINGEKARAAIARKRRTAQREKDRASRVEITSAAAMKAKPAVKPTAAKAPKTAKPAEKAVEKAEAAPAAKPAAKKAKATS